jgi:hypothetical protein
MGRIRHDAIIVTSYHSGGIEHVEHVAKLAATGGLPVSPVTASPHDGGHCSACIFPDGSKEGWQASDEGDAAREEVLSYLHSLRDPDDGSSPVSWALVRYGDGRDLPGFERRTVEITLSDEHWQRMERGLMPVDSVGQRVSEILTGHFNTRGGFTPRTEPSNVGIARFD